MKEPTVTVDHTLYQVVVEPGEYLAVYLRTTLGGLAQVELRVTPDGQPQIFVDRGEVEIWPFSEWYSIE